MPLPHPPELFARFERGEIERDELQRLMAQHARGIIEEMEEDYRNPAAAWWEGVLARRTMQRLLRLHGARLIREVLLALSEADFPGAGLLWNANHPDVPLHCFLRMKRRPVFRLLSIHERGKDFVVVFEAEGSDGSKPFRRKTTMTRDRFWKLVVVPDPGPGATIHG